MSLRGSDVYKLFALIQLSISAVFNLPTGRRRTLYLEQWPSAPLVDSGPRPVWKQSLKSKLKVCNGDFDFFLHDPLRFAEVESLQIEVNNTTQKVFRHMILNTVLFIIGIIFPTIGTVITQWRVWFYTVHFIWILKVEEAERVLCEMERILLNARQVC